MRGVKELGGGQLEVLLNLDAGQILLLSSLNYLNHHVLSSEEIQAAGKKMDNVLSIPHGKQAVRISRNDDQPIFPDEILNQLR